MAKTQKHGLGSGLSALIPKDFDSASILDSAEKIHQLALDKVHPNKNQPRRHFDESELSELAASIKSHGILQPIVVAPLKSGLYQLVAGERRWRAAHLAGLKTVPAIVRTLKELERLEIAMIENVQRVDLSPIEQAMSIEKLHQQFNLSYQEIANKLGKASTTVINIVRLLALPDAALDALNKKMITEGHARQILALKDYPEHQANLLKECINGWTVRQAERYVVSVKTGIHDQTKATARVLLDTPETKDLGKRLGTTVQVRRTAHGGRLEITFEDDDQLKKILERIN